MPCTWDVDYAGCEWPSGTTEEEKAKFEEIASELLWNWTGRRFGLCPATVRPCRQECTVGLSTYGPPSGPSWRPALVGGEWFNITCGAGCTDTCGCGSYGSTLRFARPVYDVTSVEIDGETLSDTAYRVDNHRLLVRQDGNQWPYCQNLTLPLGQEDTWAVTVRFGTEVPRGGQIAAGRLAIELAKAMCGDKSCELPTRVQSITRQGVTVAMMLDTFDDLDKGKTGIWVVDSWVASVTKPDIGFAVTSPDLRSFGRQTTWTP